MYWDCVSHNCKTKTEYVKQEINKSLAAQNLILKECYRFKTTQALSTISAMLITKNPKLVK